MLGISQERVIKSQVLQLVRTGGPTESTIKALKLQCNGTPRGGGSLCFCFIFASRGNLSHSGQCPVIFFSRTEECICL